MSVHQVKFFQYPCDPETKGITTKKSDRPPAFERGGRRYLTGITSGLATDFHGDNMLEEAIKDMHQQTRDKDIPLYVNHLKDFDETIGLIDSTSESSSVITKDGELYNEYGLHQSGDDVPLGLIEKANHIWAIKTGQGRYKKPKELGFSVEGYINDNDITKNQSGGKGIKRLELEPGVALVPKPAYPNSSSSAVMRSIMKSLSQSQCQPKDKEDLQLATKNILDVTMSEMEKRDRLYDDKWEIEDAFERAIDQIVSSDMAPKEKSDKLEEIYDDYRDKMLSWWSRTDFTNPQDNMNSDIINSPGLVKALGKSKESVANVLKSLSQSTEN